MCQNQQTCRDLSLQIHQIALGQTYSQTPSIKQLLIQHRTMPQLGLQLLQQLPMSILTHCQLSSRVAQTLEVELWTLLLVVKHMSLLRAKHKGRRKGVQRGWVHASPQNLLLLSRASPQVTAVTNLAANTITAEVVSQSLYAWQQCGASLQVGREREGQRHDLCCLLHQSVNQSTNYICSPWGTQGPTDFQFKP